jgi:hypothetical protein
MKVRSYEINKGKQKEPSLKTYWASQFMIMKKKHILTYMVQFQEIEM